MADERDRRVPRDDRADDADRFAHEQAERTTGGRRTLLLERERVGERGVRRERTRADPSRVLRRLVEHAGLARPQLTEHVVARLESLAERADVVGALGVREAGPRTFVERVPGRGDGARHVFRGGLRDRVVQVLCARVDHIDGRIG